MPTYVNEGDAIEGKKIYCQFEHRPSYGLDEKSEQTTITITGNPAVATIHAVWKLKR